jgi:hypothetical protein
MSTAIEQRLDRLVHELNEIKKEMILQKVPQAAVTVGKISAWHSLSGMVSAQWDHISAVDEIRQQRRLCHPIARRIEGKKYALRDPG